MTESLNHGAHSNYTCHHVDERENETLGERSQTQKATLSYDSTYMKCSEQANPATQ